MAAGGFWGGTARRERFVLTVTQPNAAAGNRSPRPNGKETDGGYGKSPGEATPEAPIQQTVDQDKVAKNI